MESGYLHLLREVAESYDCINASNKVKIITHSGDSEEYWVSELAVKSLFGQLSIQGCRPFLDSHGLLYPDRLLIIISQTFSIFRL